MNNFAIEGQIMLMLCKNALRSTALNAFGASTSKTAPVCLFWKILLHELELCSQLHVQHIVGTIQRCQ